MRWILIDLGSFNKTLSDNYCSTFERNAFILRSQRPPPPPILVCTSDMCYVTIFDDFRNLLLNSQKLFSLHFHNTVLSILENVWGKFFVN